MNVTHLDEVFLGVFILVISHLGVGGKACVILESYPGWLVTVMFRRYDARLRNHLCVDVSTSASPIRV